VIKEAFCWVRYRLAWWFASSACITGTIMLDEHGKTRWQPAAAVLAMTKGQVYEYDGRLMIELRQQKTDTPRCYPCASGLGAIVANQAR
jgi:hypothetical protein